MILLALKEIGVSLLVFMGLSFPGMYEDQHPFTNLSPMELKVAYEAKRNGIDPAVALAIVYKESRFMPLSVSKTSDYGLFQIHCGKDFSWCRKFKIKKTDLFDIETNIKYGFKIIKFCQAAAIKACGKHKCRHWLFYYNHDNRYVRSVTRVAKRYRKLLYKTFLLGKVS